MVGTDMRSVLYGFILVNDSKCNRVVTPHWDVHAHPKRTGSVGGATQTNGF